jgi:hypothetical protein
MGHPYPAPSGPGPAAAGLAALAVGYLSGLVVLAGVSLGVDVLAPSGHRDFFDSPGRPTFAAAFANWDGKWYAGIARDGYAYHPDRMSNVAFFPAYPLLGRAVARATGLSPEVALVVVSNVCLVAALALLADYARRRFPGEPDVPGYAVAALALCPIGVFFRAAYTESLFVLIALLVLYGVQRRWPILLLALLAGLATATRAAGLALALPVAAAVWERVPTARGRAVTLAWAGPLAGWGLAAFMAYQWAAFGDPFAYSQTQKHWAFRPPSAPGESTWAELTLRPFWEVYDPASPAYWGGHDQYLNPPFSLQFANPLYVLATAAAVAAGVWRRWLNLPEAAAAAGLLVIPYLARGHNGCMVSQARYAAAVVPVYLVCGHLLARLRPPAAAVVLSVGGFFLGAYAALFAARYLII